MPCQRKRKAKGTPPSPEDAEMTGAAADDDAGAHADEAEAMEVETAL